jgi:hypothetical protein
VIAINGDAFDGWAMLKSLTIQPGCLAIEDGCGWTMRANVTGARSPAVRPS